MTRHDPFIGQLEAYLVEYEGPTPLPDTVRDAVRAQLPKTKQTGTFSGPVRDIYMNRSMDTPARWGLVAAVVIGAVIIGGALIFGGGGVGSPPAPTPSPSVEPSAPSTPAGEEPTETVLWNDASGVGTISFTMPSSGWDVYASDGYATVSGYDDTGFLVFPGDLWIYGDPCTWSTTTPDTPATTVDEIIAALASQASRDASEPSDITVAGYSGRSITLQVPDDPEWDADCDEGTFGTLAADDEGDGEPATAPQRFQQGPAQIDEFWVLDVDGRPVALDITYWPDTPQQVIDEIYAVVESVTFGE
jgi:hypothetical protein